MNLRTFIVVLGFLVFVVAGCGGSGGSSDSADLEAALANAEAKLDQANSKVSRLEAALAQARTKLADFEEKAKSADFEDKDRQEHLSVASDSKVAVFYDQLDRKEFSVEILQILTGQQIVGQNKIHPHQLESAAELGKKLIYFEVKVTNNNFGDELGASYLYFTLESTEKEIFQPEVTRDTIVGNIHRGRSTRGGVVFELYSDSTPQYLRFNSPLEVNGVKLVAVSPDLTKLISP